MQITVKIPAYATEQGKVTLNGVQIPQSLKNRISDRFYGMVYGGENPVRVIRDVLFKQARIGHYFTISKTYAQPDRQWLNDKREGFATYRDALKLLNEWKAGALEGAKFNISVKFIG